MSLSFSVPYNITLSDESPTITYFPYRDGPTSGGWNLTCLDSVDATWIPQSFCSGPSSHITTFIGASVLIEFEGIAAYIYGNAGSGSYVIQVDEQINSSPSADSSSGLLAKSEGLPFGQHKLFLNVTQSSLVSFSEAVVTVGLGLGNSSTNLSNRTLAPFTQNSDGLSTLNPQFTYTGEWYTDVPGTIGATGNVIYPRQHTSQTGASVTFNLEQTSAFFIYGLVNLDLGPFSVTLTPPWGIGSPITTSYNSNSHWISLDQVMYWQTGLDRNQQYSVEITNLGEGDTPWWDFSHIDIIDAGSSSSGGGGKHAQVQIGVIAGAAIGAAVLLLLVLVLFFRYRKRRDSNPVTSRVDIPPNVQVPVYMPPSTTRDMSHSLYGSNAYDSVPVIPGYSTPYNPLQQPLLYAGYPEVRSMQLNNLSPPPAPSEFTSSTSYQNPLVALSWNDEEASSRVSIGNKVSGQRTEAPRIVQEEDTGTLSSPGENVVRLPPGYKDAWSQGTYR